MSVSFGDSPSSRVASAIISNRQKVNGLYVPQYQQIMLPDTLRHEVMITPSSSAPAFGSICILDFKEKNVILHNLALNINISNVSGTTGGTLPNLNLATWFIDRLEIYISGQIMGVTTGLELFLLNQILENDESRSAKNAGTGYYSSAANRNAFYTSTNNNYYVNLKSMIDVIRPAILNDSHNIQFKLYFQSLANLYNANGATGTPTCTFNSCSLVSNITRLDQNTVAYKMSEISKMGALQTQFLDSRPANFTLQAGITSSSMVLSQINGRVSFLWFVIRPTSGLTGSGMWAFTQVKSWALVDGAGQNIVGGTQIPALMSASVLNPRWTKSSYCAETSFGTNDQGANFYCFNFGSDSIAALKDGVDGSSRIFNGTEQLQLTFNSALATTFSVDVVAYCECVAEQTMSGFRKIQIV